jgi:hypothetical protein
VEKTVRPRHRRRLLKASVVLLLVLAGLAIALPWIASGASGRDYLLRRVNAALAGTLHATDLELTWTGGQVLGGVELFDPQGQRVLRFDRLHTDAGLLSLLTGDLDLGHVVLTGLDLDLVRDEEGKLNLSVAIGAEEEEKEEPDPRTLDEVLHDLEEALPSSLRVDLEVRDARVRYRDPALAAPVEWTGAAELTLAGAAEPVFLHCRGETAQAGNVDLKVTFVGPGAARSGARLRVQATCEGPDARLAQVVGARLDAELELETTPGGIAFEVEILSPRLTVGGAGLLDAPHRVSLTRPLDMAWKADPRLLGTGDGVELPAEVLVTLRVESLEVPLDGSAPTGRAALTVGDGRGRVQWAGRLREVVWRGWRADLSLAERIAFELRGRLASQGQEGTLSLTGTARDPSDWKRARIDAVAKLDDFPLDPFEEWLGRDSRLVDLLGERMDLDVRVASEREGKHVVGLRAESTHLVVQGPVEVDAANERVAARGLTALWRLSPRIARRLFSGGRLDEAVPVRLQVESLATRLTRFDPQETALTASLSIGDGSLAYAQENVAWHGLMASVAAGNVREGVQLRASGEITQGDEQTTIDIAGNLGNLWNDSGAFEPGHFQGELTARLLGLPARALGLPDDALGGRCDADLEATGGAEASQASLVITAPNLDAHIPLTLGEEIAVENATARYRPPPKYADGEVVLTVPRLRIPVPWNPADLRGEARLRAEALVVSGATLADLDGRIDAETFLLTGRVTGLTDPRLQRGLAPPVHVRLEGRTKLDQLPAIETLQVQLKGALLDLHATARLEKGARLVVTEPAVVDYQLRPGVLEHLDLAAPVQVHVEVPRLEVPLEAFDYRAIVGRAELTAPRVALQAAMLRDVRLTADAAEELTLRGGGRIARPGEPRPFSLAARYRDEGSWDGRVENLSLHLVEAFVGGEGLVEAFGAEATVELVRGPGGARCRVRTPHLELDAEGPLTDGIELSKPATARWTVTPAAWPAGDFEMRAPAVVEARINRFRLPLRLDGPVWEQLDLLADVDIPTFDLLDPAGEQPLNLRQWKLVARAAGNTLHVTGGGRLNEGGVRADARFEEPANLAGHASWAAMLALPKPRGELREAVTGHGEVRLADIPAWLLDRLFVLDAYARTVLGPTASATANWRVVRGNGPLRVQIDAPRAKAEVDARLTRDGVRLEKDLTADLTLTQELGALVLPKLGPFFRGLESAEHPVRVRITPKGFLVPLERFDIRKVQVSTATFDLGRAVFDNAWLTDVLQLVTKARAPGGKTSAWFTPLDLELTNGVIRYRKRVDLLTQEKMHLASWGEVDLGNNRLDLTFAFMPEALRHHLGVSRAKDGDALRIPIRGTIDAPKIVLGNALGDLAKIQLREKAIGKINDSFGRAIAEAVLERLFTKSLRGGAVPPSTVDPLPWTLQEEEEQQPKPKQEQERPKDD